MNLNTRNYEEMIELMKRHKEFDQMLFGMNEDGENTQVSINEDNIVISTYQRNGWIRENVYWRDGTVEELYEGRWEKEA